MVTSAILRRFRQLLGPKGYCDDADVIAPWLSDWRRLYHGVAPAMLSPATVGEVQAVVALAQEVGVALVPQGGNSSMVGGATPPTDGSALLLSLRRLNQIRSLDEASRHVAAEAGVILETLHNAAESKGLRFPLTLAAKGSATVGGLVSTNAGGTQVLRFGTMRRLVLGVEAVLPNGTLFSSMNALKKDNRGFDLGQVLVGAEGTLGVITAARLQLFPEIADKATAWLGVQSPQIALKLLRWLEARSGEAIESFEIIPQVSLDLVLKHIPDTRAPLSARHAWHILVDFVAADAAQKLEALLASALAQAEVDDAVIASNSTQASAFWRIRESVSEAERASGPAVQHDIAVPVDDMPDFMLSAAARVEAAFPDVTASAFGHLGDGNVHFHVRAPAGVSAVEWRSTQGEAASELVYQLVVDAGGSISAEHGIGQMKRAVFAKTADPARLFGLKAIKQALDPKSIMNPGKLLPLASEGHRT